MSRPPAGSRFPGSQELGFHERKACDGSARSGQPDRRINTIKLTYRAESSPKPESGVSLGVACLSPCSVT